MTRSPAPSLDDLRALSDAATPGPWRHYHAGHDNEVQAPRNKKPPIVGWPGFDDSSRSQAEHRANAAFIAAAVNYVRAALAANPEVGSVWEPMPRNTRKP